MFTDLTFVDLDKTQAGAVLETLSKQPILLSELLTPNRIADYQVAAPHWTYVYAAARFTDEHLAAFQRLADEQACVSKYQALRSGAPMNRSEGHGVLHHRTRDPQENGRYAHEKDRIADWAWQSRKQGCFTDILQVGIGGSDLGPRAVYRALVRYAQADSPKVHFLSGIDPDHVARLLASLDPHTTLVLVVSKSGSTAETQSNWKQVKRWWSATGLSDQVQVNHAVSVTLPGSILDDRSQFGQTFYMFEEIGGRFSVTSAAGIVALTLGLGKSVVDAFLAGAHDMDIHCLARDCRRNGPLLAALNGVWEQTYLSFPARAVLAYADALRDMPMHIQQLDCESTGKQVNIDQQPIRYRTGTMLIPGVGTDVQHSYFQMIHQGADTIPVHMMASLSPQSEDPQNVQDTVLANVVGQMVSLALGKADTDPNKRFPGNRPSTLMLTPKITPESVGALVSFEENRVMFLGFLWNINAYDQEGVQLGKVMAQKVLHNPTHDGVISSFSRLIGKS